MQVKDLDSYNKYLNGAKAMANHVSNGGTQYDAIGESNTSYV